MLWEAPTANSKESPSLPRPSDVSGPPVAAHLWPEARGFSCGVRLWSVEFEKESREESRGET